MESAKIVIIHTEDYNVVKKPVKELHRRPEGDMLFVEHDITSKLCPPLRPKT